MCDVPESRDREAVGFPQLIWLRCSYFTVSGTLIGLLLPGSVSFLSASSHYGGLPILATANRRRIRGSFPPCAFTELSKSA